MIRYPKRTHFVLGLGICAFITATVIAGTVSQYQSNLRPLGLSVVGQVQLAGSDTQAATFEAVKSTYLNTVSSKLPEGVAFTGANLNQLDPKRLYFMFDYAPRVYFLMEGACYSNALGATIATVTAPTTQKLSGTSFTIFPNTHSSISNVCASNSGKRSSSEPLLAGDFVQLPNVKAGQQLAFFLMANLDNNGTPQDTYYNGDTNNDDGFQHMIAFLPDNSQFIIIGFEDMKGGGDKDCNDVVYVVDVGPNNAALWRNPNTFPR